MTINFTATGMKGESLDRISQVIQRRQEVLHETTQQTCTAFAMQVLRSLRADTKVSKGKPNVSEKLNGDLSISVQQSLTYVVGFKTVGKKKKVPCVRIGSIHGKRIDLPISFGKLTDYKKQKIYKVTLSQNRSKIWLTPATRYIVADNLKQAIQMTEQKWGKVVKKYSGLGKNAWTKAMMMVGDKFGQVGGFHNKVINENVHVDKNLNGNILASDGQYSITVSDELNYATIAQKSGTQALNIAMMKAANSINGRINNYLNKTGMGDFFGQDKMFAATPFTQEDMNI